MPQMTLTYTNAQGNRLAKALCTVGGYPITAANAEKALKELLTNLVLNEEQRAAHDAEDAGLDLTLPITVTTN